MTKFSLNPVPAHPIFKSLDFELQESYKVEGNVVVMTNSDFLTVPEQFLADWIYKELEIVKSHEGRLTFTDYVRDLTRNYFAMLINSDQEGIDANVEKLRLCGILLSMKKERIDHSFAMNLDSNVGSLPLFGYLLFNNTTLVTNPVSPESKPVSPYLVDPAFEFMFLAK